MNEFPSRAFDEWLTSEPKFMPFLHSYELMDAASAKASYGEPDDEYTLAFNNFDELRCDICSTPIGFLLHDDTVPPTCQIVEFWQMDEDAERLLCESCYETVTKENE